MQTIDLLTRKNGRLPTDTAVSAEQTNQIHETFVQNVSHELRTPLALVMGYADLLHSQTFGELAPKQQEALNVIRNHSQQIQTIVDRIGVLLSSQANMNVGREVQFDLLVHDVIAQLTPYFEQAAVTLHDDTAVTVPPILGDADHLRHLIACLLENALKFTPANQQVSVMLTTTQTQLIFTVADTGIGMSAETVVAIQQGQQFFQADPSSTRRHGGLGLGLTLANAVLHNHQGQMTIESELGQGSRFTVTLPLMAELATNEDVPPTETAVVRRILIVDDEADIALVLQSALQRLPNCEVVTASSGAEALTLCQQQPPFDLLLTDYQMPGTDGVSLVRQVRQQWPHIITIMITAHDNPEMRRLATALAVDHLLNKQTKLTEIQKVVRDVLQTI